MLSPNIHHITATSPDKKYQLKLTLHLLSLFLIIYLKHLKIFVTLTIEVSRYVHC